MSAESLAAFLAIVAFSAYFQTITGFGLGIIVMGAGSVLDLLPVATIAAINSLLSLANSIVALPGSLRHVHWRVVCIVLAGMLPSMLAGVLLLGYLNSYAQLLKLLLGAVIIYSGISIAARAEQKRHLEPGKFFISGILSGALSGLFGLAGPPLVYQFYRQPLGLQTIRYSLIFLFSVIAFSRTIVIAFQGQLNYAILGLAFLSLPIGALATFAGKRYPPRLDRTTLRRVASAVLVAIGLSLIWPAAGSWLAER